MPVVPINYAAIIACVLSNMVLGFLWYGPLFGKQWMKLMGYSPATMKKPDGMGKLYALAALGALVMALVMAHSLEFASAYLGVVGVSAGLQAGFWNWLGFIAPVTLGGVLWERKPWALWVLNNAYQLLGLMIMGVILAVWQ